MTLKPGGSWRVTSGERFLTFLTCFVAIDFRPITIKLVSPLFPFSFFPFFFPLDHAFVTVHHSSAGEKEKTESVSQGRKRRRGRRKRRGKAGGHSVFNQQHTILTLEHSSSFSFIDLRPDRRFYEYPDRNVRSYILMAFAEAPRPRICVPRACLVATTCSSDRPRHPLPSLSCARVSRGERRRLSSGIIFSRSFWLEMVLPANCVVT